MLVLARKVNQAVTCKSSTARFRVVVAAIVGRETYLRFEVDGRTKTERLFVGGDLIISMGGHRGVVSVIRKDHSQQIRLGLNFDHDVAIYRDEIQEKIDQEVSGV